MEIVIVIIVLAVIGGIVYGACAAKKRRQALAAWAERNRLRFDASPDAGVDERFPEFECLRNGSNRYAHNRIHGGWAGRDLVGFDYHYETHSTDSKGRHTTHHHHFSAVILKAKIPLKALALRPEGLLDKVAEFFGFDDIDFESAEFSRKFHVKAADRRWAYDVIHTRTMEFLLGSPRFRIVFGPRHAMAYRESLFSPAEFEAAAKVLGGVLDRMPEYLVQQQKAAEQTQGRGL